MVDVVAAGLTDPPVTRRSATAMANDNGRTFRRSMRVTPRHQGVENREKIQTLAGEPVRPTLRLACPLGHAQLDEFLQTGGERVLGDGHSAFELGEAHRSDQEFAHNEQRPALAHGL